MIKDIALSLAQGLDLSSLASSIVTKGAVPAQYRGALSKITGILKAPGLGNLAWKELVTILLEKGKKETATIAVRSALTMVGKDPGDVELIELRPQVVELLEQLLANDAPPELLAVIRCPHCERHFTHHS